MAKFERLQLLGNGTFTSTFAVKCLNDNNTYAAKFACTEKLQSPQALALFNQSCQQIISASAQLQHANVVKFLDVYLDVEFDQHGLVMEMMDTSLDKYLHGGITQQALPFHIQTALCHDIAQALSFLHQRNIMHQNLSSKSVLLTFSSVPNLIPFQTKVSDYGMAEIRQSLGLDVVDDIFAYGALMVEIIARKPIGNASQALEATNEDHPLLTIARLCLKESNRPSAHDIEVHMRAVHQTMIYMYTLQQEHPKAPLLHQRDAPCPLKRSADAVIDSNRHIVYLRQAREKTMYQFDVQKNDWTKLPDCIYMQCSLAFIDDNLLAVGGTSDDTAPRTGAVYKLVPYGPFSKQWKAAPRLDMPTHRSRVTSLAYKVKEMSTLIVAGGEYLANHLDGESGIKSLNIVEVLDYKNHEWKTASPLPGNVCCSSGTICKDTICLLGGWIKRDIELPLVYICGVQDLIDSCSAQPGHQIQVWNQIRPNCPVLRTTCTTLQDKLLLVGGTEPNDEKKTPTNAIHIFNEENQSWNIIGRLPEPRYLSFVVPIPNSNSLLVMGGEKDSSASAKTVQIIELP